MVARWVLCALPPPSKDPLTTHHSGLSQGYFATFRGLLSIFPSTSSQVALLNLALLNLALLNLALLGTALLGTALLGTALLNLALLKIDSVKLGSAKN